MRVLFVASLIPTISRFAFGRRSRFFNHHKNELGIVLSRAADRRDLTLARPEAFQRRGKRAANCFRIRRLHMRTHAL